MKLSLFRDSYTNTFSDETIDSWDEFCDLVSTPTPGQKNGDYFIRGFCDGERSDGNMVAFDMIIIDGDQTLDNGGSCVPMLMVHEAIRATGITHAIYTSYSNNVINGVNKWRLCVPCGDLVDRDTSNQGAAEILTILHKNNLMVRFVKEMAVPSQPWFLPRFDPASNPDDNCDYRFFDGKIYQLTGEIVDSAHYSADKDGNITDKGGIFDWDTVYQQFAEGTLHQGIKSACGWYILTTDWADAQIKQHLVAAIKRICPNAEKVKRACKDGEIDKLIKYCRKKAGTGVVELEDWKNHMMTAKEIGVKEFPEVRWAIQDVIPEGLTVLAGDPKVGKSLLAIDICSSIASGNKAFAEQPCASGTVVYMSFEDPARRIKERIQKQCDLWPDNFKVVDRGIPPLGSAFYKVLDEMLLLWPDLRAIVIDTLQFVVPPKAKNVNDYDHYYSVLDPLHRWSLDNHIAVICITHKSKAKKQEGDNPFSGIIGSVGIQSNADCMIMLSRNHAKEADKNNINLADGFMDISGREVPTAHFSLDFDDSGLKWALRERIENITSIDAPNQLLVFDYLKKALKPAWPKEIAEQTLVKTVTVKKWLRKFLDDKKVEKGTNGYYITHKVFEKEKNW